MNTSFTYKLVLTLQSDPIANSLLHKFVLTRINPGTTQSLFYGLRGIRTNQFNNTLLTMPIRTQSICAYALLSMSIQTRSICTNALLSMSIWTRSIYLLAMSIQTQSISLLSMSIRTWSISLVSRSIRTWSISLPVPNLYVSRKKWIQDASRLLNKK